MTYSFKDFTDMDLSNEDISGKNIVCSYFDGVTFPASMIDVTFTNCFLNDAPVGCTLDGGSQRRFLKQNDGSVWLIDGKDVPVERLEKWL